MTHTHHTIDYIELNVADLAASKAFYEQAFGWQFNDYGPDYAGIRAPSGDDEVGGLGVGRPPGPGGSLVILYSDDLEASLAAVEAAGGTVTEQPYEFPGGRRFLFADNSGNQLAVWTPAAG
jgi:predicted enzyme related to lactoylglutathione lyase